MEFPKLYRFVLACTNDVLVGAGEELDLLDVVRVSGLASEN
jgi:hypothetical protein